MSNSASGEAAKAVVRRNTLDLLTASSRRWAISSINKRYGLKMEGINATNTIIDRVSS